MTSLPLMLAAWMICFLNGRHPGGGKLDPQVAARDHHAIHHMQDLLQMFERLGALQLGDQHHLAVGVGGDESAHFLRILRPAHERHGDRVHALLEPEGQVDGVLVGEAGDGQGRTRQVDALVGAQASAQDHAGFGAGGGDGGQLEFELAIIQQDAPAFGQRGVDLGEIEGDEDPFGILDGSIRGGQGDGVALFQVDALGGQCADAQFRPLQVLQDGERLAGLFGQCAQLRDARLVIGMRAVREIEPGDVHAGVDHF